MKILKQGVKPLKVKYIKKCRYCKSILIYDNDDLIPDIEMDLSIKCPLCGNYLYIGLFERKYKPKKHGKTKNPIGFNTTLK